MEDGGGLAVGIRSGAGGGWREGFEDAHGVIEVVGSADCAVV